MIKSKGLKVSVIIFAIIFSTLIFFTGCLSDVFGKSYPDTGLRVHYIDVGQADSILIQGPNNKNMLIDAGETKDNAVLNYIDSLNINRLDVVIATHPHSDHISEMDDVIKKYDIGEFYMPKVSHSSKTFENMLDALSEKNISPIAAKAGMSFEFDGLNCEILAPVNGNYESLNNYSVVIRLTYGENKFLFAADAEELSEKEILNSAADIHSDVLKVGHHGSSTSTSSEFLKAVNPTYAVISCGENNEYGHPHKEIIERLKNINTYITKDLGTIVITSDSKNINVYTENNLPIQNKKEAGSIQTYIGNINTKKYHSKDCSSLPGEGNRIYFKSIEEAESQGYTAHKNCIKSY